jgi:hypothetical protein
MHSNSRICSSGCGGASTGSLSSGLSPSKAFRSLTHAPSSQSGASVTFSVSDWPLTIDIPSPLQGVSQPVDREDCHGPTLLRHRSLDTNTLPAAITCISLFQPTRLQILRSASVSRGSQQQHRKPMTVTSKGLSRMSQPSGNPFNQPGARLIPANLVAWTPGPA